MTANWLWAILMMGFFGPLVLLSFGAAVAMVRRAGRDEEPKPSKPQIDLKA